MVTTHLEKEIVQNHLDSFFTPQIRSRGLDIYLDGRVMEVFIDEDSEVIHGKVIGTTAYDQEIFIHKTNRFLSTVSCSCPFDGPCKHAAAVLFHLSDHKVDIINPSDTEAGNLLNGSHRIRFLPQGENLSEALQKYAYSANDIQVSRAELIAQEDDSVRVKTLYRTYYTQDESVTADVSFFAENGALGLRCHSCVSETTKLCKHQKAALSEFINHIDDHAFLNNNLKYEKLVTAGAAEMDISPDTFKAVFNIAFKNKHVLYVKTKDSVFEKDDIERLNKHLARIQPPLNDARLASLQSVEELGNALVWNTSSSEGRFFQLIEGKLGKKGNKLTAKLTGTNNPSFFNAKQNRLYEALERFQLGPEHTLLDRREHLMAYLLENHEDVNQIIHYYDKVNAFPELAKGDLLPFEFGEGMVSFAVKASSIDYGYCLEGLITIGGQPLNRSADIHPAPLFLIADGTAYLYEKETSGDLIRRFLEFPVMWFSKSDAPAFFSVVEQMSNHATLLVDPLIGIQKKTLSGGRWQIFMREIGQHITFEPIIAHDVVRFNVLSEKNKFTPTGHWVQDGEEQEAFLEIIRSLHPRFNRNYFDYDHLVLKVEELSEGFWFLDFYELCRVHGIELFGQEKFTRFNLSPYRGSVSQHVSSGVDWFDVDVDMRFGDYVVPTTDWVKAIKENQKYVKLDDGTLGLIPEEWLTKLRRLVQSAVIDKGDVKLSKLKFNVLDELFDQIDDTAVLIELEEKKRKLLQYEENQEFPFPSGITAELRPYQISGYQWLRSIDEMGWGGILADDMGLGKTIQIISLILSSLDRAKHPTLVVVPRSLVFNWCNELDKFAPGLKYMVHYGLDRKVDQNAFDQYDIVITTYTLMVNDIVDLKEVRFHYIILDESQAIKNISSQRYKSACLLRATNKFCMTGTPIENNTFELFAQMNFLNPGMLGSQKGFRDLFAVPVDSLRDDASAHLLRKTIHPFILRRTKELVAKDLPEKTETTIFCEMGHAQRKIYEEVRAQIRSELRVKLDDQKPGKNKFIFLEGLLRLRQICNSPLLVNPNLPSNQSYSTKIDTLLEHINEELHGHNALIFSQFTSMLDLIRRELDARGIKYSYMDGSTTKRQEVIEEFDQNSDIHIFLISLKAGNTGLNLVKADYVYIIDPWWNPAVEAQAIDRTHRIGQDKHIFAYKLVCKDTVEEKIIKLQEKKKKVASDIISTDESIIKSMDKAELLALFD